MHRIIRRIVDEMLNNYVNFCSSLVRGRDKSPPVKSSWDDIVILAFSDSDKNISCGCLLVNAALRQFK